MSIFCHGMDNCFPHKLIKEGNVKSHSKLGWYNNELKCLKDSVTFFHGLLEWSLHYHTLVPEVKTLYTAAKNKYRMSLKQAKLLHNATLINNSPNKCKTAWKIINDSRNVCKTKQDISLTADDFNNHFITSVDVMSENVGSCGFTALNLLNKFKVGRNIFKWKSVSEETLLKIVNGFKNSTSKDTCIYDISSNFRLVQDVLQEICVHITIKSTFK